MMKKIVALLMFLMPGITDAQSLNLKPMRMSLGGTGFFQVVLDKNRNTRVDAEFAPEFGIFLFEGLETFVQFRLRGPISANAGPGFEDAGLTFGGRLGIRYFYDTGTTFYPFAGAAFGVDAVGNTSSRFWTFELPVGVMISLNDSVGLTLGAALRTETTFYDHVSPAVIYFPFGVFGVKALFN